MSVHVSSVELCKFMLCECSSTLSVHENVSAVELCPVMKMRVQ